MVQAFALVLSLLFLGEMVTDLFSLPAPGPALGMLALFTLLVTRGGPEPQLEAVFDGIAPNAPIFFVPALVGVVANLDRLAASWLYYAVAIVLSTAATLVITAMALEALLRASEKGRVL